MNSMDEVWVLLADFSTNTTRKVIRAKDTLTPIQWRLLNRSAAKRAREIEEQLNKLKLTSEDREHFSVLRTMMAEFINCFEANAKGDTAKSIEALTKAEDARVEYKRRKDIRPK